MAKKLKLNALELALKDTAYNWQKRRGGQGYSYREVLEEIVRRMQGEYMLPEEVRIDVRNAAVTKVVKQFLFSAMLSDLMEAQEVSPTELLALFGCERGDTADTLLDCILNPFPIREGFPMSTNQDVDGIYPGREVRRT